MQKKLVFLPLACLITLSSTSQAMQHYAAIHTFIQKDNNIFDKDNKNLTNDVSKILTKFEPVDIPTAEFSKPKPPEYLLTIMHDKIKYTMDVSPTFYQIISKQKPLTILSLLTLQNNSGTGSTKYKKFLIESLVDNTNQ